MGTATISIQRVSTIPPIATIEPSEIRYEQLDGLRGIAAFVVFLFHAVMMASPDSWAVCVLSFPLIRPFWDGPGAVTLFFVLSGFVLTLPYATGTTRKIEFLPFLIRRIARLYPAYWAVLILAVALRLLAFDPHGLSGLSSWIQMHWSLPVEWISIIKHVFMISPRLEVDDIDPVIWSLIIEMKISLFFPLAILLVTRTTRITFSLIITLSAISLTLPLHFVTHGGSSWIRAAIMTPAFVLGSYLSKYRNELIAWLRTSCRNRVAVAIAGAFLYGLVWIIPLRNQGLARFGSACGSGAFILLFLASRRLERIGTARLTRFLGNISYSFYLVHLPILITLASLLYPLVHSLLVVIGIALICSLLTAWAISSVVEVPAHKWGKRLALALRTSAATQPTASVAG